MISEDCDFNEFVESVKHKEWPELIYLIDQEATHAERMTYKNRCQNNTDVASYCEYASKLKAFVHFLRYGVQPSRIKDANLEAFHTVSRHDFTRVTRG